MKIFRSLCAGVALASTAATLFCCKIVAHPPPSDGAGMLLFMIAIPIFGSIAFVSWSVVLGTRKSGGGA